MTPPPPDADDRALGLDAPITRRDFLDGVMIGAGALALGAASPAAALERAARGGRPLGAPDPTGALRAPDPWTGYGGTGDYASANGNTRPVHDAAERAREGAHRPLPASVVDTDDAYDLVVVGGGLAGLTAAHVFARETGGRARCLVLENHAVFGGQARQNEFLVDGVRLVAPQGSDRFDAPRGGGDTLADELWDELALPRQLAYAAPAGDAAGLRVPLDGTAHLDGVSESQVDVGWFFDERAGADRPTWVRNAWGDDLAGTPFPAAVRRDLLRWRTTSGESTDAFRRRLDAASYADHLEQELGLDAAVTRFVAPVAGLLCGASPDAVSALAAAEAGLPGAARVRPRTGPLPRAFPGGNATVARHLVRRLVPDAIAGPDSFDGVHDGGVRFAALDRPDQPTRIRLGATVVRVEHEGGARDRVAVAYEHNGRLHRVRARAAVLAGGGWMNRQVVVDLPGEMRRAYERFVHAPALVVNVALTNWRFLHRLGVAACRWFDDDLGFSCTLRRPARAGLEPPPLHPDRPTVLTFAMGFPAAGRPAAEQARRGRERLLATSYAEYERLVRHHMVRLFADAGFDPRRDVAGVVLNRWLHARLVQPPGFRFGRSGRPGRPGLPAPLEVARAGYGRITFAHAELNGHQTMSAAVEHGARAAREILELR